MRVDQDAETLRRLRDEARYSDSYLNDEEVAEFEAALDRILARITEAEAMNKQPWDFATPQEENNYLQAEVDRLRAEMHGHAGNAQLLLNENRGLKAEVERLRAALNKAGDRLAQVQPGVTESWAYDIVPKAEQEIADALK